jgi:hypothetical protein
MHGRRLLLERLGQLSDALTLHPDHLASAVPICAILLFLGAATVTTPRWPFPSAEGTTWQYTLTREPENDKTILTRQVLAPPKLQKTEASLQVEEKINGAMRSTQTLTIEKGAVLAISQRTADGKAIQLKPPAIVLPAKMAPGISWNFRGQIAGINLTLPLKFVNEEEIQIAAGKFRAWHIRSEQMGTVATTAEEWFVPGVGWVKERVTQRAPTGQLLDRRVIEMIARPEARAFEASISTSTAGEAMDFISADALQIVARWRVRRAAGNTKVRAVWIAEETGGIAPAGYKIDEATSIATPPESVGTFTLSRPADGWAAGKYRVEFYVQDALVETERITIAARASASHIDGEL